MPCSGCNCSKAKLISKIIDTNIDMLEMIADLKEQVKFLAKQIGVENKLPKRFTKKVAVKDKNTVG